MDSKAQKITSDEKLPHGSLAHLSCNGAEERERERDGHTEKQRNTEPRGDHFT